MRTGVRLDGREFGDGQLHRVPHAIVRELRPHAGSIMAEWAELRRELDDTRAELCSLRELHARARNEREEIARLR